MKLISPKIEILTNLEDIEQEIKKLRDIYLESYDRKLKIEEKTEIDNDILKQINISVYITHNKHTTQKLIKKYSKILNIVQKPLKYSLNLREIEFIRPFWFKSDDVVDTQIDYRKKQTIIDICKNAEIKYNILLSLGLNFEDASGVLSDFVKTEVLCKTSINTWLDILSNLNILSSERDKDLLSLFNKILANFALNFPEYFGHLPQGYFL